MKIIQCSNGSIGYLPYRKKESKGGLNVFYKHPFINFSPKYQHSSKYTISLKPPTLHFYCIAKGCIPPLHNITALPFEIEREIRSHLRTGISNNNPYSNVDGYQKDILKSNGVYSGIVKVVYDLVNKHIPLPPCDCSEIGISHIVLLGAYPMFSYCRKVMNHCNPVFPGRK